MLHRQTAVVALVVGDGYPWSTARVLPPGMAVVLAPSCLLGSHRLHRAKKSSLEVSSDQE